jgi:two-component system, sporulation sensor kinase E
MIAEEKPAILLVDDHPANLIALEAVLGTSDYDLLEARSGPEALAILEKHDVAVILLDIQMPGMDGYQVAARIKASHKTRHIPVIFITAIYKEDPHVQEGYAHGGIDFFTKPFNPDVLRLKVGIYAELYSKNLILRRKEAERRDMELRLAALSQEANALVREREAEEKRRAAELRTILESIPDAIYVGDENGVTHCNDAALEMFGLDSREELNQHYEAFASRVRMRYVDSGEPIPPRDQPFSHALRGEHFTSQVLIRHVASGDDLVVACAAAPIILEGRIIGAVVLNMLASKSRQP